MMYEGEIIYDGDINLAWSEVGDEIKYGLREPQNVKLCRTLGLSKLTEKTSEVINLIKNECFVDNVKIVGALAKQENKVVLEAQGLAYCYPGAKTNTLNDVNFTLYQGETVALMGYNGAGKSTLFNLIAGLTELTAGKLRLLGGTVTDNAHNNSWLVGTERGELF